MAKTYIRRWLDDLLLICTNTLSARAKTYLAVLQDEKFYGEELLLKRVWEPEPFGFMIGFLEEGDRLNVVSRSRLPFIGRSDPGNGWRSGKSALTGAAQFRPAKMELAVAAGYLARYMDLSTEPKGLFTLGILRTLVELKMAQFNPGHLRKALARYAFSTHSFLRPLLSAVSWTEEQCEAFALFYDAMDLRLREDSRLRMVTFVMGSSRPHG